MDISTRENGAQLILVLKMAEMNTGACKNRKKHQRGKRGIQNPVFRIQNVSIRQIKPMFCHFLALSFLAEQKSRF